MKNCFIAIAARLFYFVLNIIKRQQRFLYLSIEFKCFFFYIYYIPFILKKVLFANKIIDQE